MIASIYMKVKIGNICNCSFVHLPVLFFQIFHMLIQIVKYLETKIYLLYYYKNNIQS